MAAIQAERFLDDLPYDPNLSCKKVACKPKSESNQGVANRSFMITTRSQTFPVAFA